MKIRHIKFENHEALGNLELDFRDEKGKAVDTIIFAGENGCGKTQILNEIFESTRANNTLVDKVIIDIEFNDDLAQYFNSLDPINFYYYPSQPIPIIESEVIKDKCKLLINRGPSGYQRAFQFHDTANNSIFLTHDEVSQKIYSEFKAIFSSVEINFTPNEIRTTSGLNTDEKLLESTKSEANLATQITQLLIDIQTLDDGDFSQSARENNGLGKQDVLDVRTNRFRKAFSFMFPNKKYKKISHIKNLKKVVFEENKKEIFIENLSSGEKQVVFRGSFLLKNQKSHKGILALIDEPEISLHPKWQLRILDFYKNLFTDENGVQTSQIFVATHSPFIIHNPNRNNDKVIILKKDEEGKIRVDNTEPRFFNYSIEEIVEVTKGLPFHFKSEFPEKIFICEDEDGVKIWKLFFENYGIEDVEIQSSKGCTTEHIENWVIENIKRKNDYKPKVFRNLDRDGYSVEQIQFLEKTLKEKNRKIAKYKVKFLPVNEIENFIVLTDKYFTYELLENNKECLEDCFIKTVTTNMQANHRNFGKKAEKEFGHDLLFNHFSDLLLVTNLKREAETDKLRFFPGKDIKKLKPNLSEISYFRKLQPDDYPIELKQYLEEIKIFFNSN